METRVKNAFRESVQKSESQDEAGIHEQTSMISYTTMIKPDHYSLRLIINDI